MQSQGAMESFLNASKTALVKICYSFAMRAFSDHFNPLYCRFITLSIVFCFSRSYHYTVQFGLSWEIRHVIWTPLYVL